MKPKKNAILIFKEKHGDRYFKAETIKQIYSACLKVLKERYEMGWFSKPEEFDKPKMPDCMLPVSAKLIEGLPEIFKKNIYQERREYFLECQRYKTNVEEAITIQKAVEGNDCEMARQIMMERQSCEYEGWRIEIVEDATEK